MPKFVELADFAPMSIQGPDARKFLQGQLTCHMEQLGDQVQLGAHCNPKGRMNCNFIALEPEADQFLLILKKDILESSFTLLKKYGVFFRQTKMSANPEDYVGFGIMAEAQDSTTLLSKLDLEVPDEWQQQTRSGITVLRLADDRLSLWCSADQAEKVREALASTSFESSPINQWHIEDIKAGLAWVNETTQLEYIPQMFNLQANRGISFNKGCYTGQEIVARMQYLGKLKKRVYSLEIMATGAIEMGAPLVSAVDDQKKVGEIVASAVGEDRQYALAVIDDKYIEEGIRFKNSEVTVQPLPYQITDEEK